ncbi:hypothetical protein AKJ39_05045 [candidate division MSBL1 archaeon SCGC-AAA259J03]|uniref:Uncharacterized protein n=1 Tax=candidate division MSBL1 archaeon SCGC-AAA259J03 TaxID=1698269 RepID=A0A656YUL8_9EURY|nr:hypothetical protein AKJ39_05045 [candidate division MSBL1 archaeon SCGC-AAA259J03]
MGHSLSVIGVLGVVRRLVAGDTAVEGGFSEALELAVDDLVRLVVSFEVQDYPLRLPCGERASPHKTIPDGSAAPRLIHGNHLLKIVCKRERKGGRLK